MHPLFEEKFYDKVIRSIFIPVTTSFVYMDDEIERLSVPDANIINKNPDNPLFLTKIDKIIANSINRTQYTHLDSRTITNIRHFLRAIYFRLDSEQYKNELLGRLKILTE